MDALKFPGKLVNSKAPLLPIHRPTPYQSSFSNLVIGARTIHVTSSSVWSSHYKNRALHQQKDVNRKLTISTRYQCQRFSNRFNIIGNAL